LLRLPDGEVALRGALCSKLGLCGERARPPPGERQDR